MVSMTGWALDAVAHLHFAIFNQQSHGRTLVHKEAHVAFGLGKRERLLERAQSTGSIRLGLADQGLEHQAFDQISHPSVCLDRRK